MELTPIGYVLLPLALVLILRPTALLQLTLIASAFGAAVPVIVNLGGEPFGLPTGFLPAVAFIVVLCLDCLSRARTQAEREVGRIITPMLLFTGSAVAGAILLPRLFAGQFLVWPQQVGILNLAVPLAPNAGNITQSLYLVVNVAALLFVALYASRHTTPYKALVQAYLASGYVVVGLCLWQLASKLTGIYYPDDVLYSNPRWAILTEQAFGDVSRLNGPFTEPAALSGYLCGIVFACLSLLVRGYGGIWVRVLLLLSILCILLSTSTTGIIVVAVFVPMMLIRFATTGERQTIGLAVIGVAGGALMLGVVAYLAVPSVASEISKSAATVFDATLDKPDSDSGQDRMTKDIDSLGVLTSSLGLGAGWGSVRSSSLIPGLLANSGIPGVMLLIWFAARARGPLIRARRLAPAGDTRMALEAVSGSILGTLLATVLSGPTINEIAFFIRLGLLIGCATQICAAQSRGAAAATLSAAPASARLPGSAA